MNPWDIIRKHLVSTTLEEITLNNPTFAVRFDENMKVDFVRQQQEPKEKKETPSDETLEDKVSNFNRKGRPLKCRLTIRNARMEASYRERHYIMKHVNMAGAIDTRGLTKISLTTRGVDPSSLGLGDDIHDKMTLTAKGNGPLAHLQADGEVTMKELHIPALDFMNVKGNIHYDDGEMTFTGVNARVYGGTVSASGNYNIDSRSYDIYLHGEDLDSRIPSNEPKFYCLVDLNGEIHCDGDQKHLVAFGRFSSTPGFYMLIPFNGISCTFNNRWRAVDFYDVAIDTNFGIIRTDAFHIINGRLQLGTIELVDRETGRTMSLRNARDQAGPMKTMKQIQSDMKSIRKQVEGLKP